MVYAVTTEVDELYIFEKCMLSRLQISDKSFWIGTDQKLQGLNIHIGIFMEVYRTS